MSFYEFLCFSFWLKLTRIISIFPSISASLRLNSAFHSVDRHVRAGNTFLHNNLLFSSHRENTELMKRLKEFGLEKIWLELNVTFAVFTPIQIFLYRYMSMTFIYSAKITHWHTQISGDRCSTGMCFSVQRFSLLLSHLSYNRNTTSLILTTLVWLMVFDRIR